MTTWLLTIGDEILIGQIVDTNSAWMSQKLNEFGFRVVGKSSVGDGATDIKEGVNYALSHADVVITTGGLGPTKDDITKKVLAEMFESEMEFHQETYDTIAAYFERLKRPIIPIMRDQATLPSAAQVLPNKVGSAPGMLFDRAGKVLISLPGVPFEMEHLMSEQVIPELIRRFEPSPIVHRTVLTSMAGESQIAEVLEQFESALPEHIKLAYLPGLGQVRLRLSGYGKERGSVPALTSEVETLAEEMKQLIPQWVFGTEQEVLANVIGQKLKDKGLRLGLAESCTGGYIAHQITLMPGASEWFEGGLVTYSNALKNKQLGVPLAIFESVGAVSSACVEAMALGAIERLGVDVAVSVSGILGPGGGTLEKPVGTVYIGIADAHRSETHLVRVSRDRAKNIQLVGVYALTYLLRFIDKEG